MSGDTETELAQLQAEVADLRRQLADVMRQLDYRSGEAVALKAILEQSQQRQTRRTAIVHPAGLA